MPANQQNLSEQESLQLITEMIGRAKSSYHSNGTSAIMWGLVIFFCSLFNFLEIQFGFRTPFDIWWLMWLAVLPQLIFIFKNRGQKKFVSYEETAMTYVWWAFAACILMMMCYSHYYKPEHSESLYLLLFGIPTFITGGACRFRPMVLGGVVCWALFLLSLYTDFKVNMLLMALAALFAWLIPGLILRARKSSAITENMTNGV